MRVSKASTYFLFDAIILSKVWYSNLLRSYAVEGDNKVLSDFLETVGLSDILLSTAPVPNSTKPITTRVVYLFFGGSSSDDSLSFLEEEDGIDCSKIMHVLLIDQYYN